MESLRITYHRNKRCSEDKTKFYFAVMHQAPRYVLLVLLELLRLCAQRGIDSPAVHGSRLREKQSRLAEEERRLKLEREREARLKRQQEVCDEESSSFTNPQVSLLTLVLMLLCS